jgi:hypothetical protein
LDQNIRRIANLIHGSPEVMVFAPDGFMADDDPPIGQDLLYIPETKRERSRDG